MLPVVALVGRPNVSKSTLFNALTRSRDALVADMPGVTRDRHYGVCHLGPRPFVVVDTGGLSGVEEGIDALTAQQVRLAIAEAQVGVLMIDARENLADQDLTLIGHAVEEGRALVIAVNKWDGMDAYQREQCQRTLERKLVFVDWAKTVFISALHGSGLRELMRAVVRAHASATHELRSADLTRPLEKAYQGYQPPLVRGHAPKLRFAHPGGANPPTIVIHGSRTKHIAPAYRRYLENFFRKRYKMEGTPIRIDFRDGEHTIAGRKNVLTEGKQRKRQRMIREMKKRKK